MSEEFYGRFVWTDKPGKNRYTFPLKVRFPGWPDDETSGADGTLLIKSGESWAAEVREFADWENSWVVDTTEFMTDKPGEWNMGRLTPPTLTVEYHGQQFYIWKELCWVNELKKGDYRVEEATAICIVPFGTKTILDYLNEKKISDFTGEIVENFPIVNIGDSLIGFTTHRDGDAT